MTKLTHAALIALLLLLPIASACGGVEIRDKDFDRASSERCLFPVPVDMQQAVDDAEAELARRGVFLDEWDLNRTTALPGVLMLSKGFWSKPIEDQSATLWHELVHYCDREHDGALFDLRYLDAEGAAGQRWRYVYETRGLRETVRSYVTHGTRCSNLREYIYARLEAWPKFYRVERLMDLEANVIPILQLEAPEGCEL